MDTSRSSCLELDFNAEHCNASQTQISERILRQPGGDYTKMAGLTWPERVFAHKEASGRVRAAKTGT
jgi:hypothetical protein